LPNFVSKAKEIEYKVQKMGYCILEIVSCLAGIKELLPEPTPRT